MTILQIKFYQIPVVIENIRAGAHITYYAHITTSYSTYFTINLDNAFQATCRHASVPLATYRVI